METSIRILPPHLVEKIAAGEVVERPASVVKELVENSIDAQATKIFIYIKNGGLDEIRVVDNGIGMSREEAKLAFKRHATSKIVDESDLFRIKTLGFRGEALPSIAAVSRVEMLTKRKDDIVGTKIVIEGGEIKSVSDTGCPAGTSVTVRDLFFNTPARRKFLKSPGYEFGYIKGVVEKYILAYENTHFKLVHNGKKVYDASSRDMLSRIRKIWGKDVAESMVEIKKEGYARIRGYVSKPYLTRKDKNRIVVFVNGRFVNNSNLSRWVIDGYRTLLFRDSYPYAVIRITVPPEDVDVNVHPAKLYVKFKDEERVKSELEDVIWNTLTATQNIPAETPKRKVLEPIVEPEIKVGKRQTFFEVEEKKERKIEEYISQMRIPRYEVLGQVDDTYIIMKSHDSLIIVDQHAAHERIRYEKFLRDMKEGKIQRLLNPVIVNLGSSDYAEIIEMKDKLRDFGLEIDDFGNGSIVVRAIPPILKRDDVEDVIRGIIDIGAKYIEKKRDELIKLISCKGAIKAHEKLTIYEMEELVAQLLRCENPYTCPHGRPTMIKIKAADLEKMFKRKD